MANETISIAIVGGGALGGAIARGFAGSAHRVWLVEPDEQKRAAFAHATAIADVAQLPVDVQLALLVVKPAMIASVATELGKRKPAVVVSLAAGVASAVIRKALGEGPLLYRAMMSTAAAQRQTTTALCPERNDTAQPEWLDGVFSVLGDVVHSEERLLDAIMAVSASAPAFFLAAAEGLADGGVRLGLTRALAETLALGAMRSAFAVASSDAMTPAKYRITSPGGTTIEGLAVLERMAVKAAFSDAACACANKARELLGGSKS